MTIICKPYYSGNKIILDIDVSINGVDEEIMDFISVTIKLTSPKRVSEMIANEDIYRVCNNSVHCHYSTALSGDLSGKYVVTVVFSANGRFLGTERNVFEVECLDRDTIVLHNPSICWREEKDGAVSIFGINGNLLFIRGRLKTIWMSLSNGCNLDELIVRTGIDSNEMEKLITVLEKKKILVRRKKIRLIFGGAVYEFD